VLAATLDSRLLLLDLLETLPMTLVDLLVFGSFDLILSVVAVSPVFSAWTRCAV
jgi:hypothetical protein